VSKVYLTNAVNHFKWRPQGKRRIHERPNREEMILRAPDEPARREAMAKFVRDLQTIARATSGR
jgi:hypothetical protein